jgi:hypothetical protein
VVLGNGAATTTFRVTGLLIEGRLLLLLLLMSGAATTALLLLIEDRRAYIATADRR